MTDDLQDVEGSDIPGIRLVADASGQLRIEVDDPAADDQLVASPPPHSDAAPPRLRRVWLRNFKSFRDFEVSLGYYNVLAGANNAGKSTLLQGIDLLYVLLKLHVDGDHLAKSGRLVPPQILPVASLRDLWHNNEWRRSNVPIVSTVGAEFADGSSVEFGMRLMFGNVNCRVTSQNGFEGARLASILARPAVWVPSAVGIVRDEEYRPPARQRGLISGGRHNEVLRNLLVEIRANHPDRLERLQTILRDRFDAGLGDIGFNPELDQFVSADYEGSGGARHDLYSAGAGFIQVVQLLAFIFATHPSVLLLDEPDAHLHSSMQRVIVEILDDLARERGFQVLLATHSKEIINFVDPTRLVLIESSSGQASPVGAEVTPITILRSLGSIDNVDAYALVKNRRCVFLEGTSDGVILGRFAACLGVHSLTGDDRVVVVPVGGADHMDHVQQLNVLEAVLGAPLESVEVRDRDGMIDDYRQRTVESSTRPLHVLALDCIESYLIHPAVLTRVINELLDERSVDRTVDEAEIKALILEIADGLRTEAEDRLAERYSSDAWKHDKERPAVHSAMRMARPFLADNWGSLDGRLTVLPGKRFLGAIRQQIQTDYGVNFGNERLAEAFSPEEVPEELRELVARISSLRSA